MDRYERDAIECKHRRENLEKLSGAPSRSFGCLLPTLAALAAHDAIAKRDVSSALGTMRAATQIRDLQKAADDAAGRAKQDRLLAQGREDDQRNQAAHRKADMDAASGRARRIPASPFASESEWFSGSLTPSQRIEKERDAGFFDQPERRGDETRTSDPGERASFSNANPRSPVEAEGRMTGGSADHRSSGQVESISPEWLSPQAMRTIYAAQRRSRLMG